MDYKINSFEWIRNHGVLINGFDNYSANSVS